MNPEYQVYVDDVMGFLGNYNGPKFSFLLSDPPYEINHISNEWDRSGITFSTDLYKLIIDVMNPGSFVVLYGYARTHHRVMVAMEDAGMIIHKAMFAWVYASGNPLGAKNIQRNIDNFFASRYGGICKCESPIYGEPIEAYIDERFKKSAIPVFLCQNCHKPIREILETIKWGKTGGMKNIGGHGYGNNNEQVVAASMTPEAEAFKPYSYGLAWSKPMLEPIIIAQTPYNKDKQVIDIVKYGTGVVNVHNARYTSRWPGNLIAIHSPGCRLENGGWVCTPDCEIADYLADDNEFDKKVPNFSYSEADYMLASVDRLLYDSKPQKKERNGGLLEDNTHPSLKPLSVNEYLGKLFLPPSEYFPRHALNLFTGSGSEAIGLLRSGWDNVTGVEMNAKYASMSLSRAYHFTPNISYFYLDMENGI